MKKSIISIFAGLLIIFSTISIAGDGGCTRIHMSPSTINLTADGRRSLTIITLVEKIGTCTGQVMFQDAVCRELPPEAGCSVIFDSASDDLSFYTNALEHVVIRVSAWDNFRIDPNIETGMALFTLSGECNDPATGDTVELTGTIDAEIINYDSLLADQ